MSAQGRGSGDPLAELARLIGQDDNLAGSARGEAPRRRREPEMSGRTDGPEGTDWMGRSAMPGRTSEDEAIDARQTSGAGSGRRGRFADLDSAAGRSPPGGEQPGDDKDRRDPYATRGNDGESYGEFEEDAGYGQPSSRADGAGQGYETEEGDSYQSAAYDEGYEDGQEGSEYGDNPYYSDDGHMPPHGEDVYDDAPRQRSRSALKVVLAVIGLAVVGTAGAFAYRAWTGSGTSSPPIIRASTEPAKIMASNQGTDGPQSKQIYDRLDRSQGQTENVVPREEEPVSLPMQSQEPGSTGAVPSSASAGSFGAATPGTAVVAPPPLTGGTPTSSSGEPRKVRTLTIRPDQQGAGGDAAADMAASGQGAAMPAATTPTPSTAPAQTPTRMRGQARTPKSASTVPLALGSQSDAADAGDASASPPPAPRGAGMAAAVAPKRTAALAATTSDGGRYVVQVSAQRNEADAQASFKALQQKYPNVLGGQQPMIRRADLGDKGIYFRAQVGPFATMDEANQLCNNLKAAGGQCIVQRN